MDSAGLAALANTVRPVVSARVIVDPVTDVSRQYGFVLFHSPADAQAAVRALHRLRVGRRTITCRLAQSVISTEPMIATLNAVASNASASAAASTESVVAPHDAAAPSNRLFVRGFPASFTRDDLLQLFEPFGTVLECVLLMRADQRTSKQIALVSLLSLEQATAALQALHGYRIGDCPTIIDVRYRRRSPAGAGDHHHSDTDSLSSLNIVGLLSPQLIASPPPGSPPSALSPRTHSPISWSPFSGVHTFLSPLSPFHAAFTPEFAPSSPSLSASSPLQSSADDADWPAAAFAPRQSTLSSSLPSPLQPNNKQPKRERPKRRVGAAAPIAGADASTPPRSPAAAANGDSTTSPPKPTLSTTCLFIHSETATAREETLRALFAPFGALRSVHVARAPDGSARGFGFVTFEQPDDASAAVRALHGTLHDGRRLKCSFAKANVKQQN